MKTTPFDTVKQQCKNELLAIVRKYGDDAFIEGATEALEQYSPMVNYQYQIFLMPVGYDPEAVLKAAFQSAHRGIKAEIPIDDSAIQFPVAAPKFNFGQEVVIKEDTTPLFVPGEGIPVFITAIGLAKSSDPQWQYTLKIENPAKWNFPLFVDYRESEIEAVPC